MRTERLSAPTPGEVRRLVLADHAALRGRLARAVRYAESISLGESTPPDALRAAVRSLARLLHAHLDLEDAILAPALIASGAWGEACAARLGADHALQREWIAELRALALDRNGPPRLLADTLLVLAAALRDDMEAEERDLLREDFLRDDVIAIDAATS
ncbi:MAG: hemerythrin domain-containing protein [Myxococcota bacterium]